MAIVHSITLAETLVPPIAMKCMRYAVLLLVVQLSVKFVASHDERSASASSTSLHWVRVSALAAFRRLALEVVTPSWLAVPTDLLVVPSVMPKPKHEARAGRLAGLTIRPENERLGGFTESVSDNLAGRRNPGRFGEAADRETGHGGRRVEQAGADDESECSAPQRAAVGLRLFGMCPYAHQFTDVRATERFTSVHATRLAPFDLISRCDVV